MIGEEEQLNLGSWGDAEAVPAPQSYDRYSRDLVLEAAFSHYRMAGFPYRHVPVYDGLQQINQLAASPDDVLLQTDVGYHLADTYHPQRFSVPVDNMLTPLQAFGNDKLLRRALGLCLDYGRITDGTLVAKLSVVSGTQAAANFRPGFALLMYRRWCPPGGTVLDTSMGFGGRLVGFLASTASRYIGIDPSQLQCGGNQRLADDLLRGPRQVTIVEQPVEDVTPGGVPLCDFAFTSPPYWCKERYLDLDGEQSWARYGSGVEWRWRFLAPLARVQYAALKPGSVTAINIADVTTIDGQRHPLVDWTCEALTDAGFKVSGVERFPLSRNMGAGKKRDAWESVVVAKKA